MTSGAAAHEFNLPQLWRIKTGQNMNALSKRLFAMLQATREVQPSLPEPGAPFRNETHYNKWQRAKEAHPDAVVLVYMWGNLAITFDRIPGALTLPAICFLPVTVNALNAMGHEWILVNAPDEVAAACGVPTE